MSKNRFKGDSEDRQGWKNSNRKSSNLSKYKIEKILDCFARDLTITEAYKELSSSQAKQPISKKTIGRKYDELRELFIYGSLTYLELFGGAGATALIGVPPEELDIKINNDRYAPDEKNEPRVRIRAYKKRGLYDDFPYRKFLLERSLREYAWNNLSVEQVWVIADFSLVKLMQRKIAGEWEKFIDYGYEYVAETNWSSDRYDFRLREDELWDKIYSTNRSSPSSYYDRFIRDMQWLINRHPLGSWIRRRTRLDFQPSEKELKIACAKWFPDGYKRGK